jgi:hypothetical protein
MSERIPASKSLISDYAKMFNTNFPTKQENLNKIASFDKERLEKGCLKAYSLICCEVIDPAAITMMANYSLLERPVYLTLLLLPADQVELIITDSDLMYVLSFIEALKAE